MVWDAIAAEVTGNLFDFAFGDESNDQWEESRRLQNIQQQNWEDSMKKAVQWRVADARKAGIKPSLAMGVGGSSLPHFAVPAARVGGRSNGIGAAVGRAVQTHYENQQRATDRKERQDAQAHRVKMDHARLELENKKLENAARATALLEQRREAERRMARPEVDVIGADILGREGKMQIGSAAFKERSEIFGELAAILGPQGAEDLMRYTQGMYNSGARALKSERRKAEELYDKVFRTWNRAKYRVLDGMPRTSKGQHYYRYLREEE